MVIGLLPGVVTGADDSAIKFYKVKAGQITYQLSGFRSGTETYSFTDYGVKSRRETRATTTMQSVTHREDSVLVSDGPWMYGIDAKTNTATKRKNPFFEGLEKRKNVDMFKTGEDLFKAWGGTVVGEDKVMGHACKIWDLKQLMTKTCVTADGLALWTKSGMAGTELTQTATSIKIGPIPASLVTIPTGMKVVEGVDPLEQLRQLRGMPPSDGAPRKKKGKPLAPEEMEQMREIQGQMPADVMEQIQKMQEQGNPEQ